MSSIRRAMVAMAFVTLGIGWAGAADEVAVTPRIERVALFKNGLGYFTSSVPLPDKARSVTLGQLPVPSLGTFWVSYSKNVPVRGLFTSMVDVTEQVSVPDFARLLSANVGRKVRINTAIEGVILPFEPMAPVRVPTGPYVMDDRRPNCGGSSDGSPLVLIRTDRGLVTLQPGSIQRVDFDGNDAKTTVQNRISRPTLRVELDRPASGEKLGVSYLARGITWSPSYLIDLSDAKTARLTAAALVVNEVADLNGVKVDLVTGFPNLRFADVSNPIAMSQSLADFLNALQQDRSERRDGRGSMITQQRAILSNAAIVENGPSAAPFYAAAAPGQIAEDLFFYPVEKLSLKRGETVYLPLFNADLAYDHIYTWKIADFLDQEERYRQDGQPPSEEIWHSCRFTNPLKMPLTTAPAQFVTDGQLTGQDICHYTAPGAVTTVRINRAMNVIAEQAEVEVERKRSAARFYGSSYDLVTIKGELKLRNRMDKAANLEVTKELSGNLGETVPQAKDTPTAKGLRSVNTHHVLVWKAELQPDEARKLTYSYDVYIRD